jgi:hypothetical protein
LVPKTDYRLAIGLALGESIPAEGCLSITSTGVYFYLTQLFSQAWVIYARIYIAPQLLLHQGHSNPTQGHARHGEVWHQRPAASELVHGTSKAQQQRVLGHTLGQHRLATFNLDTGWAAIVVKRNAAVFMTWAVGNAALL